MRRVGGAMTKDYEDLFEKTLTLKNAVIARATSMDGDDATYRELRGELLDDPELKPLLPQFVRTARTMDEVWGVMKEVASYGGAYQARRDFIRDEFDPVLTHLEERVAAASHAPHKAVIDDALASLDAAEVTRLWNKALGRTEGEPDGAITASKSLIESVCKNILDRLEVAYSDKDDTAQLLRKTMKALDISPEPETEDMFKQVLGGCFSVVNGMSGIANEYGDRHGGDEGKMVPDPMYARLTVNTAGALSLFLVEVFLKSQKDK